jgi:hypothetical protein
VLSVLSSPTVFRLYFLCLVPSFNCTWYLDPSSFALTDGCEVAGFHSTVSTAPVHQTFLPFSIQGFQLCSSSFCDIDNLIWPQPMCSELPWMLHEFAVIYQYQISLFEGFLLDVSVMVGLFSSLLYLLMESCNKSVFF